MKIVSRWEENEMFDINLTSEKITLFLTKLEEVDRRFSNWRFTASSYNKALTKVNISREVILKKLESNISGDKENQTSMGLWNDISRINFVVGAYEKIPNSLIMETTIKKNQIDINVIANVIQELWKPSYLRVD